MKWWSTVLSLAVTVVALRWSAQYLDNEGCPEAVRRARGLHVLNHHWARVDNWRQDQKMEACVWDASRKWPIFGNYQVTCQLRSAVPLTFEVARDFQSVHPINQPAIEAIDATVRWAKRKKRWP